MAALQLSVAIDAERELVAKVHTREFSKAKGYRFHPRINADDEIYDEHRVRLKRRPGLAAATEKAVASTGSPESAALASQGTMPFGESVPPETDVA